MSKFFKLTKVPNKKIIFIIKPKYYGKKYFMVERLQREIEKMEAFCKDIPEDLDDIVGEFWKGITLERIRAVKYALKCFMDYLEGRAYE